MRQRVPAFRVLLGDRSHRPTCRQAILIRPVPSVQWHVNYTVFRDCNNPATVNVNVNTFQFPAADSPTPPLATDCARQGGGGDYLSNESAYRNTLLRDTYGLKIPAGHIHTPVMTRFSAGDEALITDACSSSTATRSCSRRATSSSRSPGISISHRDSKRSTGPRYRRQDRQGGFGSDRKPDSDPRQLRYAPTVLGNPSPGRGINAARDYILGQFNAVAPSAISVANDPVPFAQCPTTPTSNVVSYIRGTKYPDQIIVIGGHYDSRTIDNNNTTADAPGANDSGSQSALVMELANILGGRTTGGGTGARLPSDLYDSHALLRHLHVGRERDVGSAALANTNLKNYFQRSVSLRCSTTTSLAGITWPTDPRSCRSTRLYASGTPRETGNTDGRADDTSKHRGMMRYINRWGPAYVPDMAMVPSCGKIALAAIATRRASRSSAFRRCVSSRRSRSPSTPDANTTVPYPPPGYPGSLPSNNTAHQHSPFDLFQYVTPSYTGRIAKVELANIASLARAPSAHR
jgi:hypothetical protein